jgi:hypothetical protein
MSSTTSKGLTYPTSGDNVSPLETVFQTLAEDVDDALGPVADTDVLAGNYAVQATEGDVGMSVDVTTTRADQQLKVTICAYVSCATATPSHSVGILCNVGGTNQAAGLYWRTGASSESGAYRTLTRSWIVTIATAGTTTIKARAVCTTNNDFTINVTHSDLQVSAVS